MTLLTTSIERVLTVRNLVRHFDISGGLLDRLTFSGGKPGLRSTVVHALNDISFSIFPGETFSVVGESGCGKSTLGRTIIGLYPPTSGKILYRGERVDNLPAGHMLPYRSKMQMIFQDPYASLNPRMTVSQILRSEVEDRVAEVMRLVGVDPAWGTRYPHEFSGGQRQRISIARALSVEPEFIVADEPISALDVSIQAQILNLLMDAQEKKKLTYLFITHDLSVVEHISTRVAVMYLGRMCELARTQELFSSPQHPYTQALLSAIPRVGAEPSQHIRLSGEVPTPINLPGGCVFHARCPKKIDICSKEVPPLQTLQSGTTVACHCV